MEAEVLSDIVCEEDLCTIGSDRELIMWLDTAFWCHEWRICEDDIILLFPEFLIGEGIIFGDFRSLESVEIEIDPSDLRHPRIDIDSCDIARELCDILDSEVSLVSYMCECLDEESCSSTGWIEDRLMFLRIHNIHEELDDMSRCTELTCISLTSHDREEVFERISELLRVVIVEPIDLREEHHDRIGITKWEIRIFENLLEQIREMICLRELVESLDIEIGTILIRELGSK